MRDLHILRYVQQTVWALTDDKWAELLPVLMRHVRGDRLTDEEIQAVTGATASASAAPTTGRGIAIVPIRGVIAHRMDGLRESSGGTSAEGISRALRALAADPSIGTIVYDVDSPGGTVPGIQELAQQMYELRGQKTQIAVANAMMASSAYWLASQADEIVSIPSGVVGSIGVFTAHQDLSKALEQEGINVTLITAGKFKTENNPFEPLTEEGRAQLQARVDEAYARFVKDVARGRGVSVGDVRGGYGQGRALPANDAKDAGLIDRIGTLEQTVQRATGARAGGMRAEVRDPDRRRYSNV